MHKLVGLLALSVVVAPPPAFAEPATSAAPAHSVAPLKLLDPSHTPLPPGVARTALEERFKQREATAALGFLCGRTPTPEVYGAASALGSDSQGRFVGGQLRWSFR